MRPCSSREMIGCAGFISGTNCSSPGMQPSEQRRDEEDAAVWTLNHCWHQCLQTLPFLKGGQRGYKCGPLKWALLLFHLQLTWVRFLQSGSAVLLNYQLLNWNANFSLAFSDRGQHFVHLHIPSARQCQVLAKGKKTHLSANKIKPWAQ